MGEISKKTSILLTYASNFFQFHSRVLLDYYFYLFYNKTTYNSSEMANQLKEEISDQLRFVFPEIEAIVFSIANFSKIDLTDLENCFLIQMRRDLDQNQDYIIQLFNNFEIALDIRRAGRFYSPNKNFMITLPEEKKEFYISYLKGFNKECLKYHFITKKIITDTQIEQVLDQANYCDFTQLPNELNPVCLDKLSNQELTNRVLTLPRIKNEETFLMNIKELVRHAILLAPNKSEDVINNSDIPIFYQLLIQQESPFHEVKIEPTTIANRLLKDYQNEPLETQIEKVKQFIKK